MTCSSAASGTVHMAVKQGATSSQHGRPGPCRNNFSNTSRKSPNLGSKHTSCFRDPEDRVNRVGSSSLYRLRLRYRRRSAERSLLSRACNNTAFSALPCECCASVAKPRLLGDRSLLGAMKNARHSPNTDQLTIYTNDASRYMKKHSHTGGWSTRAQDRLIPDSVSVDKQFSEQLTHVVRQNNGKKVSW